MRHRKKTVKLGRTAEHRNALLANQACSLIEHGRITTTLAKAKAVRPLAEKMVTLAKRGGLHARRRALALLHSNSTRTVKAVGKLFSQIAPRSANRNGGYTRVVKLGPRPSDSAPMAFIEWVDLVVVDESSSQPEKKNSKKTSKPSGPEDKTEKK
ncbi:MAG TPA: 50S ribosomal protein L17 [Terrimicrobiaceae bacterium]|nr:50S ribosomal protein L17 [Terrimicrobiaceae bacterium]